MTPSMGNDMASFTYNRFPPYDAGRPALAEMLVQPHGARKAKDWTDETLRLGLFWPYSQTQLPNARIGANNPDAMGFSNHLELAREIERLGFDFTLLADGFSTHSEDASKAGYLGTSSHAVLWALPILFATRRLGVLSTINTSFSHPVQIARTGSHLDYLSGGRWGWNIVAGFRENEARLFGLEDLGEHHDRYGEAEESVRLVKQLWSGEHVDFKGEYHSSFGQMRGPYPETSPLLVSAASSARGREFAVANCDVLFAAPADIDDARMMIGEISDHAGQLGIARPPVFMLCDLFVRDAPGQARAEFDQLLGTMEAGAMPLFLQQYKRVTTPGRTIGQIPGFIGTPDEVAEQIIETRRQCNVTGLLFRTLLWSAENTRRLEPVLALLRKAGVWMPPEERGAGW
jgi:FMNH2-dependent dimethyl sulfone monooxygenase